MVKGKPQHVVDKLNLPELPPKHRWKIEAAGQTSGWVCIQQSHVKWFYKNVFHESFYCDEFSHDSLNDIIVSAAHEALRRFNRRKPMEELFARESKMSNEDLVRKALTNG